MTSPFIRCHLLIFAMREIILRYSGAARRSSKSPMNGWDLGNKDDDQMITAYVRL